MRLSHQIQSSAAPHLPCDWKHKRHRPRSAPGRLPVKVCCCMTCRRCKKQFTKEENGPMACRYHPNLYTGGEVTKAVGFLRESAAPEHWVHTTLGRSGLMRFWDCCGSEDPSAIGCCVGPHVSYDTEEDASRLHT